MKKLLITLLLFFPANYSFSKPILSLFGYEFGMTLNEIPKENWIKDPYEFELNMVYTVKPIVKSKEFEEVKITITKKTKKIFQIEGIHREDRYAFDGKDCRKKILGIAGIMKEKYGFDKFKNLDDHGIYHDGNENNILSAGNEHSRVVLHCLDLGGGFKNTIMSITATDYRLSDLAELEIKEAAKAGIDPSGF